MSEFKNYGYIVYKKTYDRWSMEEDFDILKMRLFKTKPERDNAVQQEYDTRKGLILDWHIKEFETKDYLKKEKHVQKFVNNHITPDVKIEEKTID